jgi:hypothetical protein
VANRLLDRQVSLLDYLTSSATIFGAGDNAVDTSLHGMNREMLRLEALFSHQKRMEKIRGAFPKTFELLGSNEDKVVRDFVAICPPMDISRVVNARQFHDFLSARWRRGRPEPPHLPDVAACELACLEVFAKVEERESEATIGEKNVRGGRIRRRPGVVLLRCSFDVRPIFEEDERDFVPPQRNTPIAVARGFGISQHRIFELPLFIFDLLGALDNWTDPAEFGAVSELQELIRELAEQGLLEMRE